jgi:hypothetical protein
MYRTRYLVAMVAIVMVVVGADRARAASYIGFGAATGIPVNTKATSFDTDTVMRTAKPGYGGEAQFGWETAPWIDIEGALRYHHFGFSGSDPDSVVFIRSYTLVGFEGGIRVHPRRGLTNSMPYVRLGLGSFSPSIDLSNGSAIGNATTLGAFVGIGYTREISSSYGIDVRATGILFNAFNPSSDALKLKSRFIAIAASLVVF